MNLRVLYFTFCVPLLLAAQDFTNFVESDGLIDNSVNCIAVDINGKAWIGTNGGLSSFDGMMWQSFTTSDGLINNSISAVYSANDGSVWVGTDFGISVYDGVNWQNYSEENGLGDNRINHINEDENGFIWVGEKDGLSVFNGETWIAYNTDDGLPFGGINHVAFDAVGDKWLASSIFGMIHFDGIDFTVYNISSGLINNNVRSIAIDSENNKWVATGQGISVFNDSNEPVQHHTMMLPLPPPDTLNPVVDVDIDSNGNVWAGIYVDYLVSVGGIASWNGMNWVDYHYVDNIENSLVGPVVRDVTIDSQNNIWVATSTGLSKISAFELSVSDTYNRNQLNVFPNPSGSMLFISSPLEIERCRVLNVNGSVIYCPIISTDSGYKIDVNMLDKGAHILEFITPHNVIHKTVIIQ